MPPAMPEPPQHRHFCRCLRHHEPHPSNRGGQLWSWGPTQADCTNTFGASSHRELKTLAIIVDTANDTHQQPRDHGHHVWVLVDAAVDFQIIPKPARQPLHKATDSSLGTKTLHL